MNWEFDLVGIIDADDPAVRGNTDVVLINVAYFDEARAVGKGKTGWYIVRVADPDARRAPSSAHDRPPVRELARRDQDAAREGVRASASPSRSATSARWSPRILVAVFFTILLLTGNTMAQSIRERIPELAVLKTLGFSDGKVTALVLAEALLLCAARRGAIGMARRGRR